METRTDCPKRYARVEAIEAIGKEGLHRLQESTVAILGAGNLGGEASRHLVTNGVGVILIDNDVVEEVNLSQGFREADLGLPKSEARAKLLRALNSSCRVTPIFEDVEHMGLGRLRNANVVMCCLDSLVLRVGWVTEMCWRLGKPLIDAAVDGTGRLFGKVAAYDPRREDSPCPSCGLSPEGYQEIIREGAKEPCPSWRLGEKKEATPTLALSPLPSVIDAWQALWALKILVGHSAEVVGKELWIDLAKNRIAEHRLERNVRCLFDHRCFDLIPLAKGVDALTLEDLFDEGKKLLGGEVALQLHRRAIIRSVMCPTCGGRKEINKVHDAIRAAEATCPCGSAMQPVGFEVLEQFTKEEATSLLERTLGQLGLPAEDVVTAMRGEKEVHFLVG